MSNYFSIAFGLGSKNQKGEWLEIYYPKPLLAPSSELLKCLEETLNRPLDQQVIELTNDDRDTLSKAIAPIDEEQAQLLSKFSSEHKTMVICLLEKDADLSSTPEAYLKLHLLSHRLVKPQQINLKGIFPLLPNVAWTNQGAIDLDELRDKQIEARNSGTVLEVKSVDKFPKITDYVVPTGVRIAHTARVRLGAYLGEGTTVMHEGFINFNAGCEGPNMIEGRISAGVFVGSGSDLGGGCSTMGTLSGGNDVVITVGKDCLLGANAGLGIPLGDRCTIEAGLYITGGAKIEMLDNTGTIVETVKAGALANKTDLLFIRHSITGAIQCRTNKSAIALNDELHSHN